METITLTKQELYKLGEEIFLAAGVDGDTVRQVVEVLVEAELKGMPSHGFSRIPFYADQVISGKVKAKVSPVVSVPRSGVVMVDACDGFAFPAINAGLEQTVQQVQKTGICALGVTRSNHCGILGTFVERMANRGYIAIAFANTPAAMAPWGGRKACFGTNPIAFACPRPNAEPLVIDLSLSKVARGKIMVARQNGTTIPEGWALDAQGHPTTDAKAALTGTMVPLGDAKGAALALMVEILAASLTGANHAYEASSFFEATGPAAGVGQLFIIIDPKAFHRGFLLKVETLFQEILVQEGTRLPGARGMELRQQKERNGVNLPIVLYEQLQQRRQ